MGVIAQRCLGVLQELSAAIRVTRAPLLLAGLSLLILSTPAQVLELYLLLARNWARLWPQVLLALGSLVALSIFITLVSRGLIHANEDANAARKGANSVRRGCARAAEPFWHFAAPGSSPGRPAQLLGYTIADREALLDTRAPTPTPLSSMHCELTRLRSSRCPTSSRAERVSTLRFASGRSHVRIEAEIARRAVNGTRSSSL